MYRELPLDVVFYIIEFIDDPDIRRAFGIYNKLTMSKYNHMNIGYKSTEIYSHNCLRRNLYNDYDFPEREQLNICDDYIGYLYLDDYSVKSIFRLKPVSKDKSTAKSIESINYSEYKGTLTEYYWDFLHIQGEPTVPQ